MDDFQRHAIDASAQRDAVLSRRGASLVELIVALTVAGLVLAAATESLLRQQRAARWVGGVAGAEGQMRSLAQLLPAELALLDAGAGDVAAGQASDSTIQIRAVVASSLACDSATNVITLLPEALTGIAIGGSARVPAIGDSVWFFAGDSLGWRGTRVAAVARVNASCATPASPLGPTHRLTLSASLDMPGGTPLRVTRQERYVIYRASDGRYYLGARDWSLALAAFGAPQPIAGPFIRALPSGAYSGFSYFDSVGASIVPNGTNERDIVRVRVISFVALPTRSAADSVRRDSVDVALEASGAP